MNRIAITGCSGFIGRYLIKELEKHGYEIIQISRSKGLDINSWDSISNIPRFDVLIHLAARTFVPDSFKFPFEFYKTNLLTTINAMELVRKWRAKIIFMSSYLYGNPEYLPIDEKHPLRSHNPYAQTKLIGEKIVEGYCRDFNLNGIAFRLFNLYGPGQAGSFLIPKILQQLRSGKIVLNDPRPKRDYIHITDVSKAIISALNFEPTGFEVFNLGSGQSHSVEEIVNLINKFADTPCPVHFTNEYRQNEVMETVASIEKVKKAMSWSPKITLKEGIISLFSTPESH